MVKIAFSMDYVYKDKLKLQHESATYLLCTNVLHFYVALLLGRF